MTSDPTIREQSYRYFLQEAPELLQILEQELFSLRENYSINKIHNLMRTTHTLKGAAASVGLETIKSVAHSLEDIFKALFNPEVVIDPEVEALLFEGYECLRLPITAELTGGQVNDTEILDRTAVVFAQLQDNLGDCFSQEAHIPSSVELGFDVTQSIFEVGVNQRLEELAAAIASADLAAITTTLRTQAEVFQGLAESLNLVGFGAIAQAALAALDAEPEQAITIAQAALEDFRAGQEAVVNGDRILGGQPSLTLQQLAGLTTTATDREIGVEHTQTPEPGEAENSLVNFFPFSSSSPIPNLPAVADSVDTESQLDQTEESINSLLEVIWGGETAQDTQISEQGQEIESSQEPEQAASYTPHRIAPSSVQPEVTVETASSRRVRTDSEPTPMPQRETGSHSSTVRVNVEHLEHLNYSIGELLTNHNLQELQNEQLHAAVRVLLTRLKQHEQRLGQLQDWSDRLFIDAEKRRLRELGVRSGDRGYEEIETRKWGTHDAHKVGSSDMGKMLPNLYSPIQNPGQYLRSEETDGILSIGKTSNPHAPKSKNQNQFDSLELDHYNEAQILVQLILEDAVQLAEASEAIDLFSAQSTQTLEKQRRLLTSARDAVMEARMLPLREIMSRFPRVLQQLEALHDKWVVLELRGTDVLVDKVVAEKLYGPLLHLVRNAFDHGIELPAIRRQRGKSEKGLIEMHAYYQGKSLVIEIRDDGKGLNFEAIRQRAVELQLVDAQQVNRLTEAQLTDFLFEPGFSTASQVNDLSGRGMGLDIVRSQLNALQGTVSVYSEPQRGTTFLLQIPLSLTISKLLVTQAGERIYALLSDAIEQILIPQSHQIRSWEGGKVLQWGKDKDERLIPVHSLSNILNYFSQLPESFVSHSRRPVVGQEQLMPIILIRCQDKLVGLEVDQLIGEQELVIRPLGSMIAPPSYIYGGSILADGRLTLVIDGALLIQQVFDQQTDARHDQALASSTAHLLPLSQQQRQLPTYHRAALPASPEPDFRARANNIILLVDDSITLRQTLALTLQKAGYQVLQAKDGYEAIEQLRHQAGIQLVICDIEMPRMNGFEFLKHRQQDSVLAKIPVVILTSRSGEKHRLIASELGATDYMTKPFLEHKLIAKVADVIENNALKSVSR